MILNKTNCCFVFFLFIFNSNAIHAQTNSVTSPIDSLVKKHVAINESKHSMPGFRIQIYFGGQRSKAMEIKADFNSRFPETTAYLLYHQPNFKVRIGDFRTRLEAVKLLDQIKPQYSVSFIVKDDIALPFGAGK